MIYADCRCLENHVKHDVETSAPTGSNSLLMTLDYSPLIAALVKEAPGTCRWILTISAWRTG